MTDEKRQNIRELPYSLRHGPLGLGDPNDRKLRKVEKDIIINKMVLEEAEKKCAGPFEAFLDCAKKTGLLVILKCNEENKVRNACISSWIKNPEFIQQITDKYIDARSHYRKTGQALNKYVKVKNQRRGFC